MLAVKKLRYPMVGVLQAWVLLTWFLASTYAQFQMPLFGPKHDRAAWQDFQIDPRYADDTVSHTLFALDQV